MTPAQKMFWFATLLLVLMALDIVWIAVEWPAEREAQCRYRDPGGCGRNRNGRYHCSGPYTAASSATSTLIFHAATALNLAVAVLAAACSISTTLRDDSCHAVITAWQVVIEIVLAALCYGITAGCYGTLMPQTSLQWLPAFAVALACAAAAALVGCGAWTCVRAAYPAAV